MAPRFSQTPRLLTLFFTILFLLPLFTPVNFVIIQPGEGTPLFPKVLQIKKSDATTYKANGQVYLLNPNGIYVGPGFISYPSGSLLPMQKFLVLRRWVAGCAQIVCYFHAQ